MTSQVEDLIGSEPGRWIVELAGGSEVEVTAHGYRKSEGKYMFTLLLGSVPASELVVARFDLDLVRQIWGG